MELFYWNTNALGFLISGILFLSFGFYVLKQARFSKLHLSFFAISLNCSIWLEATFLLLSSKAPFWVELSYKALYFGLSFVVASIYAYSSISVGCAKKQKTGIILGFLSAAVFTLLIWTTPWIVSGYHRWPWGYYSRLTIWGGGCYLVYFTVYMLLLFRNFLQSYRQANTQVLKRQAKFVLIGFFIAYIATIDFLPCYGINVFPIGAFTIFFLLVALGYTVIRYKLFDIETVIHKTLMWLVTTIVAITPFAALIYWTQRLRDPASAWGSTLYFLSIAVAFFFYYRALQPRLDHLFQRQRRNLLAVFAKFSQELVHLKNLRDLLQSFARMLRRQIYVRRLSVFLFDEKSDAYVPVIAKGLRNLKPFPHKHPFLAWLEAKDTVVMRDLIGTDPEVETFKNEIEEFFCATQGMVAVPFVLGDKLIGLASLGRKANLKRYRLSEVEFLAQLKVPVTIAFSNSMRYENINELYTQVRKMSEELKRWNVELEHRVEDRTRELVRTQEQLIQAEKLATLGTLAGGVAHEINNPLTAVLTNAQILKMTATEDVKESLDLIEEGAKRCQGIVQKLMKYARKTAEETPHRDVDLREVVKGTCALLGFQFQQENITVEMKLGEVPPVKGIAGELDQVLTNLLVNARDAIHAAKVIGKITVETREATGAVELVVTDNGIGISKENQKKIFDPFFTTKDVGSGTGLGLAVSFGILKRHSATITVQSVPGKGATFTVRFPSGTVKTPGV